jgi:16S rRNA (guanine(1405)-N(7))-methyltransferase
MPRLHGAPHDRPPCEDAESALVDAIARSSKYRPVWRPTIADIVRRELAGGKPTAQAGHAARRKLHRILAAYHGGSKPGRAWRELERALASGEEPAVRDACRAVMRLHATSAERLGPIDDGYYQRIFRETGRPSVVFDLASALHPFAFRWMDLPRTTVYRAYDLNRDFVDLVAGYLALEGVCGGAVWGDILCEPPQGCADIAFFLQTYHCVEARRPGAGRTVLETAPARHVVVSLPKENFGGRRMRQSAAHGEAIEAQAAARGWGLDVLEWPNEIVWIVRKPEIAGANGGAPATAAA